MYGAMYSYGVFFVLLRAEVGLSNAQTSGAYSFYMVLHGLFYIVTGRLNDRFGPKKVMTLCGILLGIGYFLMSRITSIWQLYLTYGLLIAAGMSGGYVPLISTVSKWFVEKRSLMTGICVAGVGVGTMVMPPLANWLIYSYGWRISFIAIGVALLFLIVLGSQFLKSSPDEIQVTDCESESVNINKEKDRVKVKNFSLYQILHTKQFWLLCATFLCFGFYIQTIMVHIVPFARNMNLFLTNPALIMTVIGAFSIIGRISMGACGDRIGNRAVAVIGFFLMLVAACLLIVLKEAWALYLFGIIFGFAYGGLVSVKSPLLADLFGLRYHGTIFGILTFVVTIGGGIGPSFTGYMVDLVNSYHVPFILLNILSIISLLLILLVKPTDYYKVNARR